MTATQPASTSTSVTATDGVVLAVHHYTDTDPHRPTILAIHGYPDNHHVWDAVAEQLTDRYNVVAYDVRGAGDSATPNARSGYRLPQLLADLGAVIDHLGVDRVHLLGHDWGSIQSWAAVTDAALMPKIASYTSISGSHLDYGGAFLRSPRHPRALVDVVKQVLASGYIWLFLTPGLPEAVFRAGLGSKVVEKLGRIGNSSIRAQQRQTPRPDADYRNGLNLYRANMPGPLFFPADPLPPTNIAVQVLAPRNDIFITPALQRFNAAIPVDNRIVGIEGGHWIVTSRPDVIARLTSEWIDRNTSTGVTPVSTATVGTGDRGVCDKLALVTGAGAGIGRATAVELSRQGARAVVIVDRDVAGANETATAVRAAGAQAVVYQVDVTDQTAMNSLAAEVNTDYGVVDIVVNNAGIGMAGRFLQTTPEHWDTILAVNLHSVLHGSRVFAAQMVERGQGGVIINVSSASAYLPSKSMVAYTTTKAAVLAFSEALRADLADDGITVTAVCPGFVNTNIAKTTVYAGMASEAQEQARAKADVAYQRRNYTAEATANAIIKAMHTGPPVVPIGAESKIGYAMRRISPRLVRALARYDIRQS